MALAVHENVFRFSHIGQIEIPQDSDCRQCSGLLPRRWGAPSFGAKYDRRKGLASTVTIERNHISRTLPALALAACSLVQGASVAQEPHAAPIASIYTDISPRECKLLKVETESGGSARDCRGPTGYRLIIEDDDSRMSATVVAPSGEKHPLDYWRVITPYFSSLGSKAEWRVSRREGKALPTALIIRVHANQNSETSKVTSYLAVAKITSQEICVTDRIKPGPAANEEARHAADVSANKPCLQ